MKRRTSASARFGVCLNVFAQSRIHFDARLRASLPADLIDQACAPGSDAVTERPEDDHVFPPPPGGLQTTVH